jgi:predicted Zn finger-like uncharacterized protein
MILECPSCGFSKFVSDEYAGKTVKCPKCQASIKMGEAPPQGSEPADTDATVALDRPLMPPKK